jgi:MYXO-CTERM domain-containing protein
MLALRVDVTDPAQRTFSAHPLQRVAALPPSCERGSLGDCGEDDSGATTDAETGAGEVTSGPAEPGQSSTDGPQSGSSSTSGAPTDGSPMEDSGLGARGCSCEFEAAPAPTTFGLLAVVGLSRRRRRS